MLAIVGQAARSAIGGDYQQEVDVPSLFKDVAHEFVHTAMSPDQVRHLVDRAVRIALAERTVTALILPKDLQEEAYEEPAHAHDTVHTGVGYVHPASCRRRDRDAAPFRHAETSPEQRLPRGAHLKCLTAFVP